MKKTTEPRGQDDLFTNVMADEEFGAFSQSLKQQGLQQLRARSRSRRRRVLITEAACVIALFAAISLYRPEKRVELSVATPSHISSGSAAHYITEDQMVAMFPKGSCVVAEVNGKKELVFLEPPRSDVARQ
jgi:hypothetical protein